MKTTNVVIKSQTLYL